MDRLEEAFNCLVYHKLMIVWPVCRGDSTLGWCKPTDQISEAQASVMKQRRLISFLLVSLASKPPTYLYDDFSVGLVKLTTKAFAARHIPVTGIHAHEHGRVYIFRIFRRCTSIT